MAERRMFAKTIIDSDAFLDMPLSTQALYFHLSMRADDDGFINNPKKICRMVGSNDDEMKVLFAKKFIIGFESGVIVIKHWKIHNYIQKDRYKPTIYAEDKASLAVKDNGSYTTDIQDVYTMDTECIHDGDTGKVRLGKVRKEFTFSLSKTMLLSSTSKEYKSKLEEYIKQSGKSMSYKDFFEVCEMKGYKYKNFKLAYDKWNKEDKQPIQQGRTLGGYIV